SLRSNRKCSSDFPMNCHEMTISAHNGYRRPHMRFSEEHAQLRHTVREFVDKTINPHIDAWERDGAFPAHDVFKQAGKLGLLGVNKPEAFGGMGLDYSYQTVATEELGTCHAGA